MDNRGSERERDFAVSVRLSYDSDHLWKFGNERRLAGIDAPLIHHTENSIGYLYTSDKYYTLNGFVKNVCFHR